MNLLKYLVFMIIFAPFCVRGSIIDEYVKEGLANNLALKQKALDYQKSLAALKEARGKYMPGISFNARYTRAGGGRKIDIPVGDLMNPVYQALNQYAGQDIFPLISNYSIPFLREKEQETKLSLLQPVYNPAISHNYDIKEYLSEALLASRDTYARQLTADIKTAYYNYLKTLEVLDILNNTRVLLNENLRVSKSLVDNGKATGEVIYRANAEISKLEQNKAAAEKNRGLAANYLNFLLNRPLDMEIETDANAEWQKKELISRDSAQKSALANREEFRQLNSYINAAESNISLNSSGYLPTVGLAVDYGIQGRKYSLSEKDDFWMASLVLHWNIFNGYQDEAKVQQAKLGKQELAAKKKELEKQILIQVNEAFRNIELAVRSIEFARQQLTADEAAFRIVSKKYAQGMAPQIEYMDARLRFTEAQVNLVMAVFNYNIGLVELERAATIDPIP